MPELAERLDRGLGDIRIRVADQGHHPVHRQRITDAGQHLQGKHDHVHLRPAQHGPKVGDGVGTLALECGDRGVASDGVDFIGDQLTQDRRLDIPSGEPDRELPDYR
jgi:hypothetical protein